MKAIVCAPGEPGYGICRPMESRDEAAPSHRTWKTQARNRQRFPQLPQPLLLEEQIQNQGTKPETTGNCFCKGRTRSIL